MMCYEPKQNLLRIAKSPCGRFLTSGHLTIRNNIGKLFAAELTVLIIRWFSNATIIRTMG